MMESFFKQFNIDPNQSDIYRKALTHRSYVHQHSISKSDDLQERLEFYGDAVLKFIVSQFLMNRFPMMAEGMLTKIRARLISDKSLAKVGVALNLPDFVFISDSERAIDGQYRSALLANSLEAILGAMCFDKGVDYTSQWFAMIIDGHMADYLNIDNIVDYKTFLQEKVQKNSDSLPEYRCYKTSGPEHKKVFHYQVKVMINDEEIVSKGHGESKKDAQQMAAQACVERLQKKGLIE